MSLKPPEMDVSQCLVKDVQKLDDQHRKNFLEMMGVIISQTKVCHQNFVTMTEKMETSNTFPLVNDLENCQLKLLTMIFKIQNMVFRILNIEFGIQSIKTTNDWLSSHLHNYVMTIDSMMFGVVNFLGNVKNNIKNQNTSNVQFDISYCIELMVKLIEMLTKLEFILGLNMNN